MNVRHPKFSIGIPAFKSKYLKECIEGVLAQTYTDFELIIINDCSPQPVEDVVKSFSDKRIIYAKNTKNIGAEHVVDNWNKCLDLATGDFFVLLGDDDKMLPNYLEEFNCLIEKYSNLDVFHCRTIIIDENGNHNSLTPSWPEYETVYENMYHRLKNIRQQFISDFLYRTSMLKKNGGFFKLPLAWASDDISSYIAMGRKGIAHTQTPIFCYRQNSQTISNTGNRIQKMQAIQEEYNWFVSFLVNVPSNQFDKLIWTNLNKEVIKSIQKKKIRTIAQGVNNEGIGSILSWFLHRKSFGVSIVEIVYALIEGLKLKFVSKKY